MLKQKAPVILIILKFRSIGSPESMIKYLVFSNIETCLYSTKSLNSFK